MDKREIAELLDEMGTLLELKGENPFRVRAYRNAALVISTITADIAQLVSAGTLTSVKGVGKGLAGLIAELVTTGTSKEFEELRNSIPAGLREMLRIQGLGPKRVRVLYEKMAITTIDELKQACEEHRLRTIGGFGAKTEENILHSIAHLASTASKHLYSTAEEIAGIMASALRELPTVRRCEVAGSVRRRKELIGDVDLIASVEAKHREKVFDRFTTHERVASVIARGETKSSVLMKNGMQCDLRLVEADEYPFALNYFTGSKEHNVGMRSRALKAGWSLNEYGFSKAPDGARRSGPIPRCRDERDIYAALGLEYIPPELREDQGEFEAAEHGHIPKLVTPDDIRGTFHCHTTASDGVNTLDEMAAAAEALGWQYLGIADHSQAATYAGGLPPSRAKAQMKAIDRWNERAKGFRIFKGTECDILADGSLDYPDALLAQFDYVVASIHSRFKMTQAEATARLVKALRHPHVTMLGHPTGRLLLEREGYPVDMTEVVTVAAGEGKAIEINAHPMRLDIDWRYLHFAKQKGLRIFINPDAHTTEGLNDVRFGVGIARQGWLEPSDIVNCGTTARVAAILRDMKPSTVR